LLDSFSTLLGTLVGFAFIVFSTLGSFSFGGADIASVVVECCVLAFIELEFRKLKSVLNK